MERLRERKGMKERINRGREKGGRKKKKGKMRGKEMSERGDGGQ